jgi:sulfite exporter TauE/SafE
MPIDLLTLGAALLAGVMGSLHCLAMCGGIAVSLGTAAGPTTTRRSAFGAATTLNLARVLGYVLAGAMVGGIGGALAHLLDLSAWQTALRIALGAALMLIALRLFGVGDRWNLLNRFGARFWQLLAPLQRRLLPANSWPRRTALGVLWGWLPCGLSSSLLMVAWLEADPLHGALVMFAFGVGTLPAMITLTWSGSRISHLLANRSLKAAAAGLVFLAGLLTALAPWLMSVPALHSTLALLGCRSIG